MKKGVATALKITGITLGSLIAVVLIAVSILCYVVFTPKRLTPIVNQVADSLLTCPHELEEVNLTFFRTFPNFGLSVKGLYIINPMEGAQSDTLLAAPEVLVTINIKQYLDSQLLDIKEVYLPDIVLNPFINQNGETNFDILALESDTTPDTTATILPFDIRLHRLSLNTKQLSFVDLKDSLDFRDLGLKLSAVGAVDSLLNICATIDECEIDWNGLRLSLTGNALIADTISVDVTAESNTWPITQVLSQLPEQFASLVPSDISIAGNVRLNAHVAGQYAEDLMPLIDAHVALSDGVAKYKPLPYTITDLNADADAHIDFNNEKACSAKLNSLKAKTKNTTLSAKGQVTELLADMLLNIQASVNANIPDFDYFIPDGMDVTGRAKGDLKAKIHLSDLTNMRLEKGLITGDLKLDDIHYTMDSMDVTLPVNTLTFRIPNAAPTWRKLTWLEAKVNMDNLAFNRPGLADVQLGTSELRIELGDVMKTMPIIFANVQLSSEDKLVAKMDTINADIKAPRLTAYVEYDIEDTTKIPIVNAKMAFNEIKCNYNDINAHLLQSELEAKLSGTPRLKSAPKLSAAIRSKAMTANMGKDVLVATNNFDIEAKAAYNPQAKKQDESVLLQWNPQLHFDLTRAEVDLAAFPQHISVPQVKFDFSNRKFTIETSQIKLGKSDFSLTGEVYNIGKWLQKRDTLVGELNFVSEYTDVNQMMELFSADSGSEEENQTDEAGLTSNSDSDQSAEDDSNGPFLVPQRVDLVLKTKIKEAKVFNETAYNLGGQVYIRNGALVLEEMGFVCNAAKLQLTAMYRTPRRNHLYLGLDYHMLDVDIEALIGMLPQIDSMIPMLKSFKGNAEFHLAGETFLNQNYQLKTSTLRGACSLFGKDLVVLDSETFDQIAKLLMFKKSTENKVDSISAEITLYKKEVDIYPFVVSMDNYMVALGGRHNLDMSFDYHVNVLSPIYLGVDVKGTPDDLSIKLAKCIYAKDFRPIFHRNVDTQSAELRSIIRESMRKNVKLK